VSVTNTIPVYSVSLYKEKVYIYLLGNSFMPSSCDNQIDTSVDGYHVPDDFRIKTGRAEKSSQRTGDETCSSASYSRSHVNQCSCQLLAIITDRMRLPEGPLRLSIQPATGSFQVHVTIDGRTMINGRFPRSSFNRCSLAAFVQA
jgi:hypothetical protein